jgi:hypothetical protein
MQSQIQHNTPALDELGSICIIITFFGKFSQLWEKEIDIKTMLWIFFCFNLGQNRQLFIHF